MARTLLFSIFLPALHLVHARQNATVRDRHLSVSVPRLPAFMQKSDPCACTYKGKCSCEGALRFMSCIKEKCDSGDCKCVLDGESHFRKACVHMQSGCPAIGLDCGSNEATCDGEVVGWGEDVENSITKDDDKEEEEEEEKEEVEQKGDDGEQGEQEQSEPNSEAVVREDQKDLPDGWERVWSEEENRYYYTNRKTGGSSWTKPKVYNIESLEDDNQQGEAQDDNDEETSEEEQDLPPGWEAVWSKDKERYYYHNSETGKSTWVKPEAPTTTPQSKYMEKGGQKYVLHDHYKHRVKQLHSHEHHIFAKGIIAIIVVMSLTIALASSHNATIEKNTWSTLDSIIVTFLALAWFYVTMHFLDFHGLIGWAKVTMHCGIGLFLLMASSLISMQMLKRGGKEGKDIFNNIFDHILMWSFAGFVSTVQQIYKRSAFLVLMATLGLVVFYSVLALVWYYVVGKCTDRDTDADSINTLAGAALAAGIVLWVHMMLAGGYHTIEDPRPTKPGFYENLFMNCFSFIYIAVALMVAPKVQKWSDALKVKVVGSLRMYWKKRVVDSFGVFVGFLPYYSCVLSLGHFIIDNLGYAEGVIESRLYLAVVSSLIGMFLIVLVAKVKFLSEDPNFSSMFIGLGGFMAGAAWANLLNNSINMMAHGYTHPFKLKFAITCFLTAIVFPVYFNYFKPLVDAKMQAK